MLSEGASLQHAPKATRAAQRVSDLQIHGRGFSRFPPLRGEGHSRLRGESADEMAVANQLDNHVVGMRSQNTMTTAMLSWIRRNPESRSARPSICTRRFEPVSSRSR